MIQDTNIRTNKLHDTYVLCKVEILKEAIQ
jgi:hypothetical protein